MNFAEIQPILTKNNLFLIIIDQKFSITTFRLQTNKIPMNMT